MDFHLLIVISCVFLASVFSLLFINKFFRRKTFEEIIAEKKALSEKIYGKDKALLRKPKKQTLKKELKREKKQQRQKDQLAEQVDDSDAQSEQPSVDEEQQQQGLSKQHVEFEPEPEVVTYETNVSPLATRRSSYSEKENANKQTKGKKDKKSSGKPGILVNRNETANILKDNTVLEAVAAPSGNNFEIKHPKDVVELKKQEKKDDKNSNQNNKKEKNGKKNEKIQVAPVSENIIIPEVAASSSSNMAGNAAAKELKQQDEKIRQGSPKTNQQKNQQKQNKKNKESKDAVLMAGLEKLSELDSVSVTLLMNLFRRAELNRSEIQILIDYLLNRQQDMPSSHSEWSDDICQKLKRQLEEKEKALADEQEASIGIQEKLRQLRTEINTERANMQNAMKIYSDKLQNKDQDIVNLEKQVKTLNENLSMERQKFQAQLIHEKQAGSQDLLTQLQMMQNELAHKDKCIAELTCIVNASRQAVEESQQRHEILQTQAQQLRVLERERDELEQVSNNRIFELEKAKQVESELNDAKVELRNLQNALESARSDAGQTKIESEALKSELAHLHNKGLLEKQKEIDILQVKNNELSAQLLNLTSNKTGEQHELEQIKKQLAEKDQKLAESEAIKQQIQQQLSTVEKAAMQQATEQVEVQKILHNLKSDVAEKNKQLHDSEQQSQKQQELQTYIETLKNEIKQKDQQIQSGGIQTQKVEEGLKKMVDTLQKDVAQKSQQLQAAEQQTEKFSSREKELLQVLQEQKEKNNQQEKLLAATGKASSKSDGGAKEESKLREILQRLCPEAVKACTGSALSLPFDLWAEQVLATYIKQQPQISNSHKATQSASSPSAQQSNNSHNNKANGSRSTSSSVCSSPGGGDGISTISSGGDCDKSELLKENTMLRIRIDELTQLARKTENILSDLMQKAQDQDEHWREIVSSKDHEIMMLEHRVNI